MHLIIMRLLHLCLIEQKKLALNQVKWSFAHQQAFDYLKEALTILYSLRYPDYDKTFVLITDVSNWGIGAVLLQEGRITCNEITCTVIVTCNVVSCNDEVHPMVYLKKLAESKCVPN